MSDNPTNVVSLSAPTGNPEVVADFRTMLSDALSGHIRSYVVVRVDHNGGVHASYFYDSTLDEIALSTLVNRAGIEQYD